MATLHYCSDSLNFTTLQFQVEKEGSHLHENISQEQKHHACVLNTSPRSVPSLNGIIFQLNSQANSSYWIALPENWSKAKWIGLFWGFLYSTSLQVTSEEIHTHLALHAEQPIYFNAVTLRLSRCLTGGEITVLNKKLISVRSGFMHNTWLLLLLGLSM